MAVTAVRRRGRSGSTTESFDAINTRKRHQAGVRQVLGSDPAGTGNRWIRLMTLLELDNMVAVE
jgi:hypothetical protein